MHERRGRIYLDHNATTPLRAAAAEAMRPLGAAGAEAPFGNPSSVHAEGRAALERLERARAQVARALGAEAGEVVFAASATEANNAALKGLAFGPRAAERRRLVVSAVEHPSVLGPARWLAQALGFELVEVPVDADGVVRMDALAEAVDGGALAVSLMAANNETGALQPVAAAAALCRERGALLHVDATQALGRVPVDVSDWGAHLVTVSSHKVGGPRGAGALWTRRGVKLVPLVHGGHQERNRRAGTEDVAAVVGFGAACEEATRAVPAEAARLTALRERLWEGLAGALDGLTRLGDPARTLPNTLNVLVDGADGETMLIGLDLAGVAASSGSACTAGSLEPSHVLLAMGLPSDRARGALRLSLGHTTTRADVDAALARIPPVVRMAREEAA